MSRLTFTRQLDLSSVTGENLNVNMFLEQKPLREQQKCKTLTKYIQKYPSGWKKRLELADLLYEKGEWTEAIEQYLIVIERQPQLIAVRLKLGKIWHLLGETQKAIEIYKSCLNWIEDLQLSHGLTVNVTSSHKANKFHILGLIDLCQENYCQAIKHFSCAAVFAPENCSHWLALGRVYQQNKQYLQALKAFDAILSRQPNDLIALLNIYDVLIILSQLEIELPSDICHRHGDMTAMTDKEFWLMIAEEKLNQAIQLGGHSYPVLYRQVSHRCLKKQVLGAEGKKTKKLLKLLIKIAPEAKKTQQIKEKLQKL